MGKKRIAYRILVGNTEIKKPLALFRSREDGNTRMDLKEIESGGA
jgi:hypothetical protein